MARIVRCAAYPSSGLSDFLVAYYPTLIRHHVPFATLMVNRMTSRTRTPLVISGLIATLVLGLGLGAAAFSALDDGATTVVRQVTVEGSEPVASDGLSAGEVYDQSPDGGTKADEGATVQIGVSEGPATAEVPSVVGATEADARTQLTEAGFEVNAVQVFSDQPEGQVVAQNPSSGEEQKGSTVRINVSKGSGEVTVPDLVGQTEAAAKEQLTQLNLKANVDRVPSAEPEGTVVAQNPTAGSTAQAGSLVRLNLSDGSG